MVRRCVDHSSRVFCSLLMLQRHRHWKGELDERCQRRNECGDTEENRGRNEEEAVIQVTQLKRAQSHAMQ